MKSHADVVVVGGGIGGCSALFHLTEEGITDCVLVERDELTSGTTWHSAAQVTNFGATQTMMALKSHSIQLYKALSEDPGFPINYHYAVGGLRLATTQDQSDGYQHFISQAKGIGIEFEYIDAQECKRRHPLISTDGILGALWDPLDGDIDPAQLCQALVRRAKKAGAEVYRFNPVTALSQKADGSWIVHTRNGDIHCEKIVNAGGYRCNEIAAMMGAHLPVASIEHQYFLTEPVAEIESLGFRVPLIRCPTADFYSRQEKTGLLVGFYEQDCKTWGLNGIDPAFTMALCPDDLDRVSEVMEGAISRLPCLRQAGIHTVINGPITYTPDGLPIVGQIPGIRNAYCITGLRAGLGEGGGHGWLLAQIIAHGEACYDTWCIDPRRFTRYANVEYTAIKAVEDYQNEFRFHLPHEHRQAGRPAKATPLYDTLREMRAEFAVVNGWERAAYFKPSDAFSEKHSFRFNNTHEVVATEVETVRTTVGIMELSGFTRYAISGSHVHDWLDQLSCSRISRKQGKVGLAYFLSRGGNIKCEATIANLDKDKVWYVAAAAAEYHDLDWLSEHLPEDGSIRIENLTNSHTTLVLAGPRSRKVLERAAPRTDWSNAGFSWLSVKQVYLGHVMATAMSVSYSGELAWELHVPNEQLKPAFMHLWKMGVPTNIRPFGLYAADSMRLEKGYRHWKADLITEFNPFECGLDRFVKLEKDFVGKEFLLKTRSSGLRKRFVTMIVDGEEAPAQPGDSVVRDNRIIGTVTSAGWGFRVNRNLAMAFVGPEHAAIGTKLGIEIVGRTFRATVCEECLYDPSNDRIVA